MIRKKILLFCLGAIVIAVGAFVLINRQNVKPEMGGNDSGAKGKSERKVTPVEVFVPDYTSFAGGIRSVGMLLPNEDVQLTGEIAGKVERINFEEGAPVRRGTLLVKVNDSDLQAQLKRAEFQRNMLKDKLDRQRILLDKDAISREAFDQIQTDYNMVEADIELLKVKIDKTEIKAPFDGVMGFRYVSVGSYIQPTTVVASLVDRSTLKMEFSIPEKYIFTNLKGKPVVFTVDGNDKSYKASIYAVDSKSDPKTHTITLRALFRNSDMSLVPGMFTRVTVGGGENQKSLMIPTEAIVPQMEGKSVWVVKAGKAVQTPVVTGVRTEKMIEVTSGIDQGDTVVVTGIMQVRDGAPVEITSVRKN